MSRPGPAAGAVAAQIERVDGGGFVAIASTGSLDRDGEVLAPGCFAPLPATIPVHLDHTMSAATVVARARPFYVLDELRIDATFGSDAAAQDVRRKVADGLIDSVSVVFRGLQWRDVDGVRTCVRGELLAADLVSIPSNRDALVLSARSYGQRDALAEARLVAAQARTALARSVIADARRALAAGPLPTGMAVRSVRQLLAEARASLDAHDHR